MSTIILMNMKMMHLILLRDEYFDKIDGDTSLVMTVGMIQVDICAFNFRIRLPKKKFFSTILIVV